MSRTSTRMSLVFSCLGHAYMHLFAAFYFVIVLALERDWGMPYHELLELWTLGALLVGLGALPAGWLGDRWSASGMMVILFVGMGTASILSSFATGPKTLMAGLAGIGLFASIYHPVGLAWLVRNSDERRGKILGINGIFGSVGIGAAALVAGTLIDLWGWRAAFIVPGVVSVITGLVLLACLRLGVIVDAGIARPRAVPEARTTMLRGFAVLLLTMFLAAIVYQSTQAALPKLFSLRLGAWLGDGTVGVGALVGLVYGVAGVVQVLGGHLADRYRLKSVYVGFLLLQVPLLVVVAGLGGLPLVGGAALMVVFSVGALPAENMLLARYAPARHHGLAFGVKFILTFGSAPLSLMIVSWVNRLTGDFYWLFAGLAGVIALAALAALMLPRGRSGGQVAVSPAE